ncbi:hypothetical protein [Nocardioides houyundeii]|uniref:hypothetical protein n=1 Tax=Nocardioides houyundeii TaxID=2045452 RepID=UPI000DF26839|nr:hypothetical protein [Nocardioides houyundeii]
MNEYAGEPLSDRDGEQQHRAASERTGVPEVDAVLDQVESVGSLPVAEQVAVFERAHEALRRALDSEASTPRGL